jgi:hypothetical protein
MGLCSNFSDICNCIGVFLPFLYSCILRVAILSCYTRKFFPFAIEKSRQTGFHACGHHNGINDHFTNIRNVMESRYTRSRCSIRLHCIMHYWICSNGVSYFVLVSLLPRVRKLGISFSHVGHMVWFHHRIIYE